MDSISMAGYLRGEASPKAGAIEDSPRRTLQVRSMAASRFTINPFLCTALSHSHDHVKKGHFTTDGANLILSPN